METSIPIQLLVQPRIEVQPRHYILEAMSIDCKRLTTLSGNETRLGNETNHIRPVRQEYESGGH